MTHIGTKEVTVFCIGNSNSLFHSTPLHFEHQMHYILTKIYKEVLLV